jgi:hypothetical protein
VYSTKIIGNPRDISITGSARVNYTSTDDSSSTTDVGASVTGGSGDTTVNINSGMTPASTNETWDAISAQTSESPSIRMSKTIRGVTMDYTRTIDNIEDLYITTSISGVRVKIGSSNAANGDTSMVGSISGSVAGVMLNASYNDVEDTRSGYNSYKVRTFTAAMEGTAVAVQQKDPYNMDLQTSIGATYAITDTGTKVTIINVDKGEDASNAFRISRALASGFTFEATYTDVDENESSDSNTLELELAVKF